MDKINLDNVAFLTIDFYYEKCNLLFIQNIFFLFQLHILLNTSF